MTEIMGPEKLELTTTDIAAEKKAELLRLFPEARTEGGKIDFDRLRLALGETADVGKERYGMNWPGKADCFKAIQRPSLGTLLPVRDESVNFDESENLIIEGDNLEVLKLLQKSYQGKVKMIYIDPPYNTGTDFIYPDNYSESLQTYLEYTGQVDGEGKKFSNNAETDGRFHSKWLNMMYPRLYVARNLLRDNGVIFMSIDEHEVDNLKKLCNEVFGEENHIEDLIWAQNTTHSQSPLYSTNHEYVLVYAKNASAVASDSGAFREPKPGFQEIQAMIQSLNPTFPSVTTIEEHIQQLVATHRKDYEAELFEAGLSLDEETGRQDPWRGVYAYRNAEYRDNAGEIVKETEAEAKNARIKVWRIDNASAPAAKQAASTRDENSPNFRFYKPLHPVTGRPTPHPKTGWRWPKSWADTDRESFDGLDRKGRIYWGTDESTIPQYKRFLDDVDTNVAKSFFYDYTDGEKQVTELFGRAALFPNPKPSTLISRLISQVCKTGDLVLDFFAGSGTTAQSVFEVSKALQLNCRFALIQLPEIIDPTTKDQAAAASFCDEIGRPRTIAEITKERVRRVIARDEKQREGKLNFSSSPIEGFRVLKLATSNFTVWNAGTDTTTPETLGQQLDLHMNHIQSGRSSEDLLYEILLKSGFPLTTLVQPIAVENIPVYSVANGAMLICLEKALTHEAIKGMAELKPERVVCLDEGFAGNDQLKTNAVLIMKAKGVTKFQTV